MGKEEFALGKFGEMPKNANKERWEDQETKKMNRERFEKIANFVRDLKDEDLKEDKNNPADHGVWTKTVQSVNQSKEIPVGDAGTAGYSDKDLEKIEIKITNLIKEYSADKTAVLRTTKADQTRSEAKL